MNPAPPKSPPSAPRRRPPQISLSVMLLLMVVFAVMSAGLFYASGVPAVQEELSLVLGDQVSTADDVGRIAHIVFIMFTFTSPLLLAGVLSTGMAIRRWFQRR